MRQQRMLREPALAPAPAPAEVDGKNAYGIAILRAGSGLVSIPSPIDLSGSQLTLITGTGGARIESTAGRAVPPVEGSGTRLNLSDDDFAVIDLPFAFPYFGYLYRRAFVQSDGNVTFVAPEFASVARSLSRAIGGPPRIAPLFRDLDPTRGGSVRLRTGFDSVTVTWFRVPIYTDGVVGPHQTFEVTLRANGRIDFRYGALNAFDSIAGAVAGAVVGVFPGDWQLGVYPVDWTALDSPGIVWAGAVAEVFSEERLLEEAAVVQSFIANHGDSYDQLIVFNDIGLPVGETALAHAFNVRNEVQGIGMPSFDYGDFVGSDRRLSAVVNMGDIRSLPDNPYEEDVRASGHTTLDLLAHEVGHRFLARSNFIDPVTGILSDAILGRQKAHWSFFFNSDASVLEGNAIWDLGPANSPRFVTFAIAQTYSALDRYLMGFLEPRDVPETFLVEPTLVDGRLPSTGSASRDPETGVWMDGIRKRILVEDIIAADGERRPDATVSQRSFRHAFLLVVNDPDNFDESLIGKLLVLREAWMLYFRTHLGYAASVETELVRMLHLSTWPAAGVVAGSPGRAWVEIASRRQTDLVVDLTLAEGIATVPATVIIPAGALRAEFEISGIAPGVTTLSAFAREHGYDQSVTRLVVRDGIGGLSLGSENISAATGTPELHRDGHVTFRVRDENLVHYSGVEVGFRTPDSGGAESVNALTDANGRVAVRSGLLQGQSERFLAPFLVRARQVQEREVAVAAR